MASQWHKEDGRLEVGTCAHVTDLANQGKESEVRGNTNKLPEQDCGQTRVLKHCGMMAIHVASRVDNNCLVPYRRRLGSIHPKRAAMPISTALRAYTLLQARNPFELPKEALVHHASRLPSIGIAARSRGLQSAWTWTESTGVDAALLAWCSWRTSVGGMIGNRR